MIRFPAALRQQLPIYGAGVFSNSNVTISSIIVPLWAVYLEMSPGIIGVLLGIRHLPGLLFAIHGGVAGSFRRKAGNDLLAGIAVVVPLLFPVLPSVWAILILQWFGASLQR